MKGNKFYIILITLFVVGIGSLFLYRKQQQARVLEFEGYEIATIENRVAKLYNDDKTDINENIESELIDLEQIFLEFNEKDLKNASTKQMEKLEEDYLLAKDMFNLQSNILNIFDEKSIVKQTTNLNTIEDLNTDLAELKDKTIYYKRNMNHLIEAREQIETIEEVSKLVEELSNDDSNDERDEEYLLDLEKKIHTVKDVRLQEQLLEKIETYRLILKQQELEELALEEQEESEEDEASVEDVTEEPEESVAQTPSSNQQNASSNNQTNNNQSNNNQNQRPPNNNPGNSNNSNNQSNTSEQPPSQVKKYQETKVIEEIPFKTHYYENKDIPAGEEIVYVSGSVGKIIETYEVIEYTNDTSTRKLISKDRIEPVDREVTIGTKVE